MTIALACSNPEELIRRITPPGADQRAREYLALFMRNQVDSAIARLKPGDVTTDTRGQFEKIVTVLANQPFDSTRIVGVQVNTINDIRHANLTYQMHSASGWVLTNVATVDSAGTWFVEGVSARRLDMSLEEQTKFTFAGKSLTHYVWLLLTAAAALTSLGTALFVATRRGMPKRWWWAIVALFGVSPMDLNWVTGAISTRILSVQLLCAAFTRAGPAAPWIVTFALPIGAALAFDRYRRWKHGAVGESPAAAPTAES